MKVILDTNILVSGIARSDRAPGQIVAAWMAGRFDLIVSDPLLDELARVLRYPKVRALLAKAGLSDGDLRDYADILRMKAVIVETAGAVLPTTPHDPKDRHVLEALVASGAEFLVTGDKKHLLSLGLSQIVTAADFARRLQAFKATEPPAPLYRASKPRRKRKGR